MATGMREKTTNVGGVIKRIWYAMTGTTQETQLLSLDDAGNLEAKLLNPVINGTATGTATTTTGEANKLLKINSDGNIKIESVYIGDDLISPVYVGDRNISNSSDAQILISRNIIGDGNSHAFSDSSDFHKNAGTAYNSFDARINITGENDYDHYAAFQSAPVYSSTGTLKDYYGLYSRLIKQEGEVTNSYGAYIDTPGGAGSLDNDYGIYIKARYANLFQAGIYNEDSTYLGMRKTVGESYLQLGEGTVNSQTAKFSMRGKSTGGMSIVADIETTTDGYLKISTQGMADAVKIDTITGEILFKEKLTTSQLKLSDLNTPPATSTSTGTKGEIRIDANYIYICVAANTWKRTALTTW